MRREKMYSLRKKKKIVDWINECLPSKKLKNFESLRTGVKIVQLLRLFFTRFGFTFQGIFVEEPKTLMHCLNNADYIVNNLKSIMNEPIPGVRAPDIGAGSRKPLFILLTYIRDRFDDDAKFQDMLNESDEMYVEIEIDPEEEKEAPLIKHKTKSESSKSSHKSRTSGRPTQKIKSSESPETSENKKTLRDKKKDRPDKPPILTPPSSEITRSSSTKSDKSPSKESKSNKSPTRKRSNSKTLKPDQFTQSAPVIKEEIVLKRWKTVRVLRDESTENQIKANAARKMTKLIGSEILTTEKNYLDNLTFLVENFSDKSVSLIEKKEYDCVFANVKELQKYHSNFYDAFNKYITPLLDPSRPEPVEVSTIISKELNFLKHYEQYLTNFPTANFCLNLLKTKYSSFNNLFTEFSKELNIKNMLSVSDVLIMPVQRIPRYIMLINTLQKYSNPLGREHQRLTDIQDSINTNLLKMNSKIDPDNLKSITNVNTFLSSVQEIDKERVKIELDRRIVEPTKQFKVKDISNPNKKSIIKKRINFTLFNDIIVVTVPKKKLLSKEEEVLSYLDSGTVKNPGFYNQSDTEFTFSINGDTYVVVADDKEQCLLFVSALNRTHK